MYGPGENDQKLLFAISKSSILHEALEILAEISRTANGRSDLAKKNILPVILHLVQSLTSDQDLFLSLKLLRNLCAGERSNQESFIKEKGPEAISVVLRSRGLDDIHDHEVLRMGLQALSNVALGGVDHEHDIWCHFFPYEFKRIAKLRRAEVCDPLCMILYHCCYENGEVVAELTSNRGMPLISEVVQTAFAVGCKEDWLKLLLSAIFFQESALRSLFSILGSACSSFSGEQVLVLRILSEILTGRVDAISITRDVAVFVLDVFHEAIDAVSSSPAGEGGLPTGFHTVDVLGYSLIILRAVSAHSYHIVESLVSSGLVEKLLDLLGSLEVIHPYKGFRRDLVSVIGNCTFRRKVVQDRVRERNCILVLLQQCVVDGDEPFLREWSIWCIRNLLEGNSENQQVVAELELLELVDLPELAMSGLRVEIHPNGRPRLVNT